MDGLLCYGKFKEAHVARHILVQSNCPQTAGEKTGLGSMVNIVAGAGGVRKLMRMDYLCFQCLEAIHSLLK